MKKALTNTALYEPNPNVKIKVVNKPIVDQQTGEQFGFDVKVSLTFKAGAKEKQLTFANSDEIAEYIGNIDYDDPQRALL
ncbi:hypothetical protein CQ476_16 [TM7 phage DolZOral124_53_65]|nr:hypothetical protein CQ476_16 [TM7 phage DolZOral124_53_65]